MENSKLPAIPAFGLPSYLEGCGYLDENGHIVCCKTHRVVSTNLLEFPVPLGNHLWLGHRNLGERLSIWNIRTGAHAFFSNDISIKGAWVAHDGSHANIFSSGCTYLWERTAPKRLTPIQDSS